MLPLMSALVPLKLFRSILLEQSPQTLPQIRLLANPRALVPLPLLGLIHDHHRPQTTLWLSPLRRRPSFRRS